ncbi:unnamed protein product [Oikopleura dioica]|uniref:RING-type domain-containing protein n=1 Tax=Oikopleura dioica TaxID=34765 RepID=E4XYJ0_OIKDI|nr:unnamed protein product [Oikopleura dioica]
MVEFIDKKYIVFWGSIGECFVCKQSVTEIMGFFNNFYRCSECAKRYDDNQRKKAIFKVNDARFKCPENSCNKTLSFREFLNRSCCNVAMRYSKTRVEDNKSRTEFQDLKEMMNELELVKKEEKGAKKEMVDIQKKLDIATAHYSEKNKRRERLQVKLATALSEKSDMLFEKKENLENARFKCNICFEKYDDVDRLQCVLQCGHPACEKCLTALPNKLCPICRKPFKEDSIIKMFYN